MAEHARGRPLFDIASYARRGSGRRDRLTAAEVDQVRRTVSRTPEVMVKVLTRGAHRPDQVRRHVDYIGRDGDLALEMDDGQRWTGDDVGRRLVEDWDLDLPSPGSAERFARGGGRTPRLVHKLIFSMPPGTPSDKVLSAVQAVAREEFALKHRYAMALHTDEPHPHVHVIVKAISEQGERLNIRKDDLRRWRAMFAEQLRVRGVAANATERAVRGQDRKALKDGIYRAARRGASSHVLARLKASADVAPSRSAHTDVGAARVRTTRERVREGYLATADALSSQGQSALALQVRAFAGRLGPARTEAELDRELVRAARERQRERARSRDDDLTR